MRSGLILTFLFFYYHSPAQEKLTAKYIGWEYTDMRLNTISNDEFACTFLFGQDSIKAFLFNKDLQFVHEFTIHKKMIEKFLGGFIKDENIYLFLDNGEKPGVHSWTFNSLDYSIKETIVPLKTGKDKIISRHSTKNRFFYLAINKQDPEIILYNFTGGSNYDTLKYSIDDVLWKDLKKQARGPNDKAIIGKIDMAGECDIEIANRENKVYLHNDTLVLLNNSSKAYTRVYEFDMIGKGMTSRVITHKRRRFNELPTADNSFLSGNKVYYISATSNFLFFQIVDLYSGKILKEFYAGKDEVISFKNTPVNQSSGQFLYVRELDKTTQLLDKMIDGSAVITVTKDLPGNQVQVLIGAYIDMTSYYQPNLFPHPGPGLSVDTVAPEPIPERCPTFTATGIFFREASYKLARFKLLLNSTTNQQIPGEPPATINEKIGLYAKDIKISDESQNLLFKNGNYYYIFYEKEKRELEIVKF